MAIPRLAFCASSDASAQAALQALEARYTHSSLDAADVIVALGGDGFMLETLHLARARGVPVYGMNRGTIGFLMNDYAPDQLYERLNAAEEAVIHPLRMTATTSKGETITALAINEVSLLRQGPQAAKLSIRIDGRTRLDELVCDGVLVATPAGSTAYNYSAHGPIIPIKAEALALTPVAAFRPRRWRGALLPMSAHVGFDNLDPQKRPVSAVADGVEARDVLSVEIQSAQDIKHQILFDPGHGLEERLIREQFI